MKQRPRKESKYYKRTFKKRWIQKITANYLKDLKQFMLVLNLDHKSKVFSKTTY